MSGGHGVKEELTGFCRFALRGVKTGERVQVAEARVLTQDVGLLSGLDRIGIEMIVEQGEAPTADHPDAHFSVFDSIRTDYADRIAEATRSGTEFPPLWKRRARQGP